VRNATSGALITKFSPVGTVEAVALSQRMAAVLVQRGTDKRIDRYDATTGSLLGSTTVPATTEDTLAMASKAIVYSTLVLRDPRIGGADTKIWLLDPRNGRATPLATTRETAIGLSISGSRVAWAEDLGISTKARIQAITLPR